MPDEARTYVISLLESNRERMQEIALLHYELEHPARVSRDEVIGAMSLSHGEGTARSSGHISNKTLYIALNYQDHADRMNSDATVNIVERLVDLEHEQERLVYYISLLDMQQKIAINRYYFEGVPWEKIAQELQIAVRSVYKVKKRAVNRLAELYKLAGLPKAQGQSKGITG